MNHRQSPYKNRTLLALILLLGSLLRLYGLNWDDSHLLHPDERFMVMTCVNLSWPGGFSEYLDPESSPLSPYNTEHYKSYIYGTFPLFLTKALATVLQLDDYGRVHLVGRILSSLFDLGSLLLVFFIARRLFSERTGLVSAAFYAVAVLHIQQSHFFTVDTFLVFWIVFSFFLLTCLLKSEGYRSLLFSALTGISFGLALGSKVSAVPFLAIIAAVLGISYLFSRQQAPVKSPLLLLAGNTLVFLLLCYCTFRLVQPYAFASANWLHLTPQPHFLSALEFQRRALTGKVMFPPQWQWLTTTAYLSPLKNLLRWGLGLPLGIASLLGTGLYLSEQTTTFSAEKTGGLLKLLGTPAFIALTWTALSFGYWGGTFVKTMRYFLPLTPFLIMFAAYGCEHRVLKRRNLSLLLEILVFIPSLLWALAYCSIYSHDTTRIAASRWIYAAVPETSILANEEWDDPLPLPLPDEVLGQEHAEHKHFESFLMEVYAPDTAEKAGQLYRDLVRADYIILSSPRARATIGRLPEYFPLMSRYYRLLESGRLGFEEVKTWTAYPHLSGWEINDAAAEESFWVYDHPPVHIYKKVAALFPSEWENLLSN